MFHETNGPPAEHWERDLVGRAVDSRFAERHRPAVLAELGRMRAAWLAAAPAAGSEADGLVRLVVRTQMDVIEQSGGDPAFLTDENYRRSAGGMTDRDRLWLLDQLIQSRQLTAKPVATLLAMLDSAGTRLEALSVLERKGAEAAAAVPRLVGLLQETDQLECCKVLRTLAGIGPAARGAVPAVTELATDPDHLVRLVARAALRAIAPDQMVPGD